jgi:peptide/nickel transport system permease protein
LPPQWLIQAELAGQCLAKTIIHNAVGAAYQNSFRETLTRQFGLDKPLWWQYLRYCGEALTGNLGVSYQ